jgi:probable DNA repair protein
MTEFKPDPLFERLAQGRPLLTGNSRLARVLGGQYNRWRQAAGDRQWPTPPLRSWNAWVSELWDESVLHGLIDARGAVPGRQQLLALWETVLADDPLARTLVRPESLAGPLSDTRALVVEWQVELDHPAWQASGGNENCAAFTRWNKAFESLCRARRWTPPEDRLPALTRALHEAADTIGQANRAVSIPSLDLLGFDELSPAQEALLAALAATGTVITRVALPPCEGKGALWRAADHRDELQKMARWVRHCHERDPRASIAVVVPDLADRRSEVERQLRAVLAPGSDIGGQEPWNISYGEPLGQVPAVDAAFDLLRITGGSRVDIRDVGRVLRSPWIRGGRHERGSRGLLEKYLREEYPRQFRLGELRYRASERGGRNRRDPDAPNPLFSPEMERIAQHLLRFRQELEPRAPSAWARAFDRLLAACGWPHGDGDAQGEDHDRDWQAFQAWQDALRELASLDAVHPTITYHAAVSRLQRVCAETIFQPRTPPSKIQVLGLYEIIGLRFDHLWVLGLHNGNWPPPARGNPFIPAALQLAGGLPHSGPQRELEVARTITARLLETSPDVRFSYPGMVDGEDTMPSPLLIANGMENLESPPQWTGETWPEAMRSRLQPAIEPLLPPGPMQGETARGGTSILRNQAACPFRAFAVNRLGAEGLETPADGITPRLHGSLVHRVLEVFWRELRHRDALLALDDEALQAQLRDVTETVLNDRRDMDARPAFRRVEVGRIVQLASDYLAAEKTRGPFEVRGFEEEIEYEIEGQRIRLVIDRIDRLPDGQEVIIDYKTGKVKPDRWFGDPPEEPQLPLYAISASNPPAAVVYAVLREDGCLFSGIVRREGLFPGLPRSGKSNEHLAEAGKNLTETTAHWKSLLHRLMADFLAGAAPIQPLRGRTSCKNIYCDLQPLCRIDELERLQSLEGEDP